MHSVKSLRRNSIIIFLITIIVIYFVLRDDLGAVVEVFSRINIWYILAAIALFFLSIFLRAFVNYKSINQPNKITLKEAFKHNVIIQFFNGVTPFSIGGQPMEIYMIRRHNIKVADATNITIQNFIFYQFALVILGAGAVIYNFTFGIFPSVPFLRNLVLIGFFINALVAVLLIIVAVNKKVTKRLADFVHRLGTKFKVIKDKEKTEEKWKIKLEEFHNGAKELNGRKALLIYGVLLNVVSLACLYLVPLFVFFSLGEYTSITVVTSIVSTAYIMVMASFIPIPGGSGGVEFAYLQFFGNFISGPVLASSLLLWRCITYYLGMIVGAVAFNFDKKGDMK